jgi:hypothetical protein
MKNRHAIAISALLVLLSLGFPVFAATPIMSAKPQQLPPSTKTFLATVSGYVRGTDNNGGINNAYVILGSPGVYEVGARTDANGHYIINNVPLGNYPVRYGADPAVGKYEKITPIIATVNVNALNIQQNFTLVFRGNLYGYVVDGHNTPISGASISYPGSSATSDNNGKFSIDLLQQSSGVYLSISKNGYTNFTTPWVMLTPQNGIINMGRSTLRENQYTLKGTVKDQFGSFLDKAAIKIGNSVETTSQATTTCGEYSIALPGRYLSQPVSITVTRLGYTTISDNNFTVSSPNPSIDFQMKSALPFYIVRGYLKARNTAPDATQPIDSPVTSRIWGPGSVTASSNNINGCANTARSDDTGFYSLRLLQGNYSFVARAGDSLGANNTVNFNYSLTGDLLKDFVFEYSAGRTNQPARTCAEGSHYDSTTGTCVQ